MKGINNILTIKKISRKAATEDCAICDGKRKYRKVYEIVNNHATLYMCVSCAKESGFFGYFLLCHEGEEMVKDRYDEFLDSFHQN